MYSVRTIAIIISLGGALPLSAQMASPPPAAPSAATTSGAPGQILPSFITTASVGVKEGYDSDLFGTTTNPAGHPEVANISSQFTTISANLTFDFLSAYGAPMGDFLTALTLGYAADYTAYEAVAREDNLRNAFSLQAKGKSGPWSLSIDNPLVYVDGSKEDPYYNTFTPPGFSAALQRRNQIQERNTSILRYDTSDWLFRAVDSATYYNLLIDEIDPVGAEKGYLNWVNRDDINVGADFGYKLTPAFAITAGWRLGSQTQARPFYSLADDNSTYNRVLFGFEGAPFTCLKVSFVAGPDYRRYSDSAHLGLTGDRHTWLYTESSLTATFTPVDTFTATNKVWHFVAAPGLTSDQETTDSAIYKHVFTKALSASAGVKIIGQRFDAPAIRNDWATSYPVDLTYITFRHLTVSAAFAPTLGRSHLPDIVAPGRDWDENLVSSSLKFTF